MKTTIRSAVIQSAVAAALVMSLPAFSADQQKEQAGAQTAQPPGPYGYGPGMMGGYGGYGMGPGMMGGYGGYGMGPGMMGSYGGYGMGPGMMGSYWGGNLGLTEAQQAKIGKIMDETRKANWGIMGAMMDQQAKLRDLYLAPRRDDAAIGDAYKRFGQMRQQMFDNAVNARKRVEAVLTKEQRERLRAGPGWGMPGY